MLIYCIGSDEMAKYREMYSDVSERDSIGHGARTPTPLLQKYENKYNIGLYTHKRPALPYLPTVSISIASFYFNISRCRHQAICQINYPSQPGSSVP